MKKFFKDFKKFITRGNILDMAVGVIVGGAFSKIVTSLVNDILMPVIAWAAGGVSVADLKWVMKPAVIDEAGKVVQAEAALHYGNFIQVSIDFLLIALTLFIITRIAMHIGKKLRRDPDGFTFIEYKNLRKQGKSRKEIKVLEAEKIQAARDARAAKPKPETTDDVLKDIRDMMKNSQVKKQESKDRIYIKLSK